MATPLIYKSDTMFSVCSKSSVDIDINSSWAGKHKLKLRNGYMSRPLLWLHSPYCLRFSFMKFNHSCLRFMAELWGMLVRMLAMTVYFRDVIVCETSWCYTVWNAYLNLSDICMQNPDLKNLLANLFIRPLLVRRPFVSSHFCKIPFSLFP